MPADTSREPALSDQIPDDVQTIGDGPYVAYCTSCDPDDQVVYRTADRWRAKMEARDHREWHPTHRPIARGPDGERIYG